MWLVWIDAYSKYAGVERVKSANSINTVRKLAELFLFFGNPEQIVSDNGTTFTAMEFSEFCTSNGIRHIRSAPYHPATNGEAERFVQVFKKALRSGSQADLDTELEVFVFFSATAQHHILLLDERLQNFYSVEQYAQPRPSQTANRA